jgi:aminoglycoside phosphotransferase (APT) family kinase protein
MTRCIGSATTLVARLPRIEWAVKGVAKEHQWLPWLAPLLPIAIPVPLGERIPAEGYPWRWSVYRWLDGENPTIDRITDPGLLATELAAFAATLHRIDPTDGPPGAAACRWRCETLRCAPRSQT